MVFQTLFQRLRLATVLVLTVLAGACSNANVTPPSAGLETATPVATQTVRVSETRTVLSATPSATQEPIATQTPGVLATPVPESEVPAPTPNPTLVAGLIGLWQGDNGSFYLFNASSSGSEGTWNWDKTLSGVESTPARQGYWLIYGDDLLINDSTGTDTCTRNQIGPYHAHVDGDTLSLTSAGDVCAVRVKQTVGHYTRQPAGP